MKASDLRFRGRKFKKEQVVDLSNEMEDADEYPDMLKVFIASPSDVQKYRKATLDVLETLNKKFLIQNGVMKFHPWAWETSKDPEFTEEYQKKIFDEFGSKCDIFILLFWHKIGATGGTIEEYEHFIDFWKKKNKNIKFYVAWVNEKLCPSDIDPEQLVQLRDFIKNNEDNWAPLGKVRGKITSTKIYKEELMAELTYLISSS